ncbi:MAG: DsrE family protein [Gemmatimonadetes bacterium]|nr:DsrE family protein [Gemmatimonadota bacterium]
MNTIFILNDPPYGTERSYNALRLAGALAKREGTDVRLFLLGDATACAKRGHVVPQGYYNINSMLHTLTLRRVPIGVCGTCMAARGMTDAELVDGARRSTLDELAEWTTWAGKVVVF